MRNYKKNTNTETCFQSNAFEDMLSMCKCIYFVLILTVITLMVVLASQTLPARKLPSVGVQLTRATYGYFESCTQFESTQTRWTKKFLAKREALPHSAPNVVSIQLLTPNDGLVHYCAGTIIDEHWILTAAHCLQSNQSIENSVIVAGCHDIRAVNSVSEDNTVQLRNIDFYVRHELYLGGINPYDIALIYTKTPFKFTKYVQPATLPTQDEIPEGYGSMYGWGNVSMTAVPNYPHKLQKANMPILEMELCEKILAKSGLTLHETNLCTGPLSGGVSICTADSGGPLIQQCCGYFGNNQTVIGVVSWGKMPCGQKNAPSVFVRVSAFTNWINDIISSTATQLV